MKSEYICRHIASFLPTPRVAVVRRLNRTWNSALSANGYLQARVNSDWKDDTKLTPQYACSSCGNWTSNSGKTDKDIVMSPHHFGQFNDWNIRITHNQAASYYYETPLCLKCLSSLRVHASVSPIGTSLPNARRIGNSSVVLWTVSPITKVKKDPIQLVPADARSVCSETSGDLVTATSGAWAVQFNIRRYRSPLAKYIAEYGDSLVLATVFAAGFVTSTAIEVIHRFVHSKRR